MAGVKSGDVYSPLHIESGIDRPDGVCVREIGTGGSHCFCLSSTFMIPVGN